MHESTIIGIVGMCSYATPDETLEILRILEALVVRAAEGHLQREAYFRQAALVSQLSAYLQSGGVLGLHMECTDVVSHLIEASVVQASYYIQ